MLGDFVHGAKVHAACCFQQPPLQRGTWSWGIELGPKRMSWLARTAQHPYKRADNKREDTVADKDESAEIMKILGQAKKLAQRYRALTGKPLGITGEVAEFEAARRLGIELSAARQTGYDAVRKRKGRRSERLSIKSRCILPGASKSQRLGKIDITKEFDAVLMVLMDEQLDATAIYEAPREPVIAAITAPGSKARNERGALPVSKFRSISECIWTRDVGNAGKQSRSAG